MINTPIQQSEYFKRAKALQFGQSGAETYREGQTLSPRSDGREHVSQPPALTQRGHRGSMQQNSRPEWADVTEQDCKPSMTARSFR